MKHSSLLITAILGLALAMSAAAAVRYVNVSGASPTPPYGTWATAANSIQDAIDLAEDGDEVVVTNGVYQTGERVLDGALMNRVAVTKPLMVRSVNGPQVTVIAGYQVPGTTNGDSAVRCVYLGEGATLVGFTLTNGATQSSGDYFREQSGGGVWSASASAVVSNCVLTGNSAQHYGGGVYDGTLNNCTFSGNSAGDYGGGAFGGTLNNCALTGNSAYFSGGGAYGGALNNCTLSGNSAHYFGGGGASSSTLNNCIVYYNVAQQSGANYSGGTLNYSCTTPLPPEGVGNISAEPQLADAAHLSAGSPCRGAGSAVYATGMDIDGEAWANPPPIGCDEFYPAATGSLSVAVVANYTNVATGFEVSFTAQMSGHASVSRWEFGDGTVVSNRPYAAHGWVGPGEYPVVLWAYNESHPGGVSATATVHVVEQPVHYVALGSAAPLAPYSSWATAATSIQDAVDAAVVGALVLVSNGVYQTGERVVDGALMNRVAVTKPLTVQSVNGPQATVIAGYQVPDTTNGDGAVRCVYLGEGATLVGFTLTNGATRVSFDDRDRNGGGVWCASDSAVVSNCVLTGNNSAYRGGGAYQGMLNNCTLIGNSARDYGGGALGATLNNCTICGNSADYGGGAGYSTLNNCTLTGNSAGGGGGAAGSTLNNCTLSGNTARDYGGGALGGTLINCTLTGNSADYGGGAGYSTLNNCIVFYNTARSGFGANYTEGYFNYCSTQPLPPFGVGNLTAEPQLASASHLSAGSPCRGAGSAAHVTGVDIDGEVWANPPSIGCDEFYPAATGSLSVAITAGYTHVATGFEVNFTAQISGHASVSRWEFGDGTVVSNRPYAAHGWVEPGDYSVVLWAYNDTYPGGVSATVTVHVVEKVHYVAPASSNPVAPYTSWATAATNIQDAVDAASVVGALVLVTNGVYQTGGRPVGDTSLGDATTNRVAVTKALTVRSVNGPAATVIRGYQVPGTTNGEGAVRCAYLTNGATLVGFTLTNGATRSLGGYAFQRGGGGVWCESASAVVSNCVLSGNSAGEGGGAYRGTLNNCTLSGNSADYGGGAIGCTLNNCALTDNSADYGGGAFSCCGEISQLNNCTLTGNSAGGGGGGAIGGTLNNCTLTGNSADYGGGVFSFGDEIGQLNNCIVFYNTARSGFGANYTEGYFNYCSTQPLPPFGVGNLTAEPQLAGASHLSAGSPCRGAGSAAHVTGVDIDGEVWANPPSIGCDEFYPAATGSLSLAITAGYTHVATGFEVNFTAQISGRPSLSRWEFGDGTVVSNRPYATHGWVGPGDYSVVLWAYNESYPGGVSATVTVHVVEQPVHYVALGGAAPLAPYSSWATAATNIQDAVDAASVGGALVLVSNGVYQTGGRVMDGAITNRVAVTKPLTVRSVNGPEATVIDGASVVRCVYLPNGAALVGFTLTNGAGGGVWCESEIPVVSNCVLSGNSGGGAYRGTLNNCTLTGNSGGGASEGTLNNCILTGNSSAYGGGADGCTLNNCVLSDNSARGGGGAAGSTLNNCRLTENLAAAGGGVSGSTLNNCTLSGNMARGDCGIFRRCRFGGGAIDSTLNNCSLTGNYNDGAESCTLNNCTLRGNYGDGALGCILNNCTLTGNEGAGAAYGTLDNCIVYYNFGANYDSSLLNYSCTTPLPPDGVGNFDNPPLFVGPASGNLRLQSYSPCINAGFNLWEPGHTDLDGNPRIVGGTVDVGAYEFQSPQSLISYAWLEQYGLPIDPLTDSADPDGDRLNNWQEWGAGTDPTNAQSVLRLLTPTPLGSDLALTWESAAGRSYRIERADSLAIPILWEAVPGAEAVPGTGDVVQVIDPAAASRPQRFYRVRLN